MHTHWYRQYLAQGIAKYHLPSVGRGFVKVQSHKKKKKKKKNETVLILSRSNIW